MYNGIYIVVLATHLLTRLAPTKDSDRINTVHQMSLPIGQWLPWKSSVQLYILSLLF